MYSKICIADSQLNFESFRHRAINLFWIFINRTHKIETHGYRLLKMEGYVLLANQLHQFEATDAVVDACLSIVHNRAIVLDECPEIPSHLQVKNFALFNLTVVHICTQGVGRGTPHVPPQKTSKNCITKCNKTCISLSLSQSDTIKWLPL
jgi:hypothetical protein